MEYAVCAVSAERRPPLRAREAEGNMQRGEGEGPGCYWGIAWNLCMCRGRLLGHVNLNSVAHPTNHVAVPSFLSPASPPGRVPVVRHLVLGGQVDQDGTALRQTQSSVPKERHLAHVKDQGSSIIQLVGG